MSALPVTLNAGRYGTLRVLASPDAEAGILQCRVTGVRLAGTFILEPAFDVDDIDPATTDLLVHYGGEPEQQMRRGVRAHLRPDRPVINGVTLVDYSHVNVRAALAGARSPHELGMSVWRLDARTGPGRQPTPTPTAWHAAAVVAHLAVYWLQRPDVDQLRHAAARHLAVREGLRRKLDQIAQAEADLSTHQDRLDGYRRQMQRLLALVE